MSVSIITNKHIHGKNLHDYILKKKLKDKAPFSTIETAYESFRNAFSSIQLLDCENIELLVTELNNYRKIALPVFDKLDNSGQQALGYTIMEEFFYLLFERQLELMEFMSGNLFLGKGNSYVSLSFTPSSFKEIFETPRPYLHTKDQDFVLGASVDIVVSSENASENIKTIIPVVAIECKTYLERNMLDSCAATASRLKSAMPYCIFIVASEYMKMSNASPELTDIDEVYILCKAKNAERERRKKNNELPLDIDSSLIIDLFDRVVRHLNSIWWKPDDAVKIGKIINRPR